MGNQIGWGRFYFPLDYSSPTQLVRTVQVPRHPMPRPARRASRPTPRLE